MTFFQRKASMILVDDILHSLDTIDIFDQISYQFQQ